MRKLREARVDGQRVRGTVGGGREGGEWGHRSHSEDLALTPRWSPEKVRAEEGRGLTQVFTGSPPPLGGPGGSREEADARSRIGVESGQNQNCAGVEGIALTGRRRALHQLLPPRGWRPGSRAETAAVGRHERALGLCGCGQTHYFSLPGLSPN